MLSDWSSNVLVEEIHDTREERTIEVKFLVFFAEIRRVSFWQTFRNTVLFTLFSVEKMWTVTIFNHFSLSEIRLCKLARTRCYQPVSLFKDFHYQNFSASAVDTHERGNCGCG